MKYARVKKLNYGGVIAQAGTTVGGILEKTAYNPNGSVNDGRYIAGKALSRGAQGAGIGTMIAPGIGTIIGGGIGLVAGVFEGAKGSKKMMAERDAQMQAEAAEQQRLQEEAAEQARLEAEYQAQQQEIYNQNYYTDPTKNVRGIQGASIYAKFGARIPVRGGHLERLADNAALADGKTHEQGGIQLHGAGQPLAEIEDDEVIDNDKVFSATLKLADGTTIAENAMKYSKMKGKMEPKIHSTDYRAKNTARRMTDNANLELEKLFQVQESMKPSSARSKMRNGGYLSYGEGGGVPDRSVYGPFTQATDPYAQGTQGVMTRGFDADAYQREMDKLQGSQNLQEEPDYTDDSLEKFWASDKSAAPGVSTGLGDSTGSTYAPASSRFGKAGDVLNQGLEIVTPFIDNIVNARLQKQAPEVPRPIMRKALTLKGAPLPTNYDISKSLSSVNDAYRNFSQNIDLNTNNSQVARGNKASAYAQSLRAKGELYQQKGNMETQMVSNSIRNNQRISEMNLMNKQNIDNTNAGLTDQYNMNNYLRSDRLLDAKSANIANATEDAMTLIQDRNMRGLDTEKMYLSTLEDPSGAGISRMIGTSTMDKWASDPRKYSDIERKLESAGQTKALQEFHATYGRKKKK